MVGWHRVYRTKENFMRNIRLSALVSGGIVAAMLAGCSSYPVAQNNYPAYPSASYPTSNVQAMEYGRIVNIEYLPVGSTAPHNNGILGAVLGSTIGGGSGRTAATVLGGVAGAAVGNNIARNQQGATTQAGYRITMQSDQGAMRTFEVPATGDLRVGDRVRVDNGVIYRGYAPAAPVKTPGLPGVFS
jgi:outer membrane lipoprotein SlyB